MVIKLILANLTNKNSKNIKISNDINHFYIITIIKYISDSNAIEDGGIN